MTMLSASTSSKWKFLLAVTALSLLATAITACCGFYFSRVALEKRLLQAQSQNLASIITSLKLPLTSERLLLNLKQVSNCHVIITQQGTVINSTLPNLNQSIFRIPEDDHFTYQQEIFRVASHPLDEQTDLWLLLPSSVFKQDLKESTKPIAILATIAALVAVAISLAIANAYASLMAKSREADRRLAKAQHVALAGKLSASVVHELRNPLSGIKMNAQLLMDDLPDNDANKEPLDLIVHEIDRIDQFLKGLTAVPDKDITPAQQDSLQNVLRNVLRLMDQKALKACVTLTLDNHTNPALMTPCNPLHLRQILINLITNAIDASPQNSIITISATEHPLTLSVQDQGPGVHPQDGEDIFAPFVSQKDGGFGLGLHLSQEIAAKYNATLSWKNLPEAGALFTLSFPD